MTRPRSPWRAWLLAGLLAVGTLAAPGRAAADDAPGLADLAGTPAEEDLARRALADLAADDLPTATLGARRLLLAGPPGARTAAELLGEGALPLGHRLLLLHVLRASDDPRADAVFEEAARDARHEVRAVAAHGLSEGRTPGAVAALARLAGDAAAGPRAAALRGLFAIDTAAARDARIALPRDREAALRALRLRLHRLRGDAGPAVVALAAHAWFRGRTGAERVAAARLLVAQGGVVPPAVLADVLLDLAGPDATAGALRAALGRPFGGYDDAERRLAAAEALAEALAREDIGSSSRAALVDHAVGWVAQPVRARGRAVDDEARALLLAVLPESGEAVAAAVGRRLRANAFDDPAHGVRLLLGLETSIALRALGSLVQAEPPVSPGVLAAVSGGLRDLGLVGDPSVASRLLDPSQPRDVRVDGVLALEGESPAVAGPRLRAALTDDDEAVASQAADVVARRGGPRAWLEAVLFDGPWRAWKTGLLESLVERGDDAAFALVERSVARGGPELRAAAFQAIAYPASRLRGPRALAIVQRAIDDPSLRVDVGTIGKAIAPVDGPAAVAFIRAHWRTWRSPGVLVRNLQVTRHAAAREFALEVAASVADADEDMLQEVAIVLSGACEKDPSRTDPFWRRLLSSGSGRLREIAIARLPRVPHGPMSAHLVPILADRTRADSLRRGALAACAGEADQPPDALLWRIAADRTEDEAVREDAAEALLARGSPALRPRAIAWLAERKEEPTETLHRIALLAGRGASASEAADIVQLLETEVEERYREPPYFRRRESDEAAAGAGRFAALVRAAAATRRGEVVARLARLLLDPRFAAYAEEARRWQAARRSSGGGPLSGLADPAEARVLLHQADEDPNDTPAAPVPFEASEIAGALAAEGPTRAAQALSAALAVAAADGRLAAFPDVYLLWVANRLRGAGTLETPARAPTPEEDAAGAAVEAWLPRTWPAKGPEETHALDRLADRLHAAGDPRGAAAAVARFARLQATSGLCDIPPSRWLDRGEPPGPSWAAARATEDFLLGEAEAGEARAAWAAEAAARWPLPGLPSLRVVEGFLAARSAFARGTARAPLDARVLRAAARHRTDALFDLAGAGADAARAAELERRQGDAPSAATLRALHRVRAARQ